MKHGKQLLFWVGLVLNLLPVTAFAWPVPDTGQTICYDQSGKVIECPIPGQAFYGQDASYTINPPSYTKLGYGGVALPDTAAFADGWIMTRDNVTGLIWEVKQNADAAKNYSDPLDADNTYTWYDSNPATNGGNAGTPGNGVTTFDTEQFITALNSQRFGGISTWRLPSLKELSYLVNSGIGSPGPCIDASFFPYTASSPYWSSTTYVASISTAWQIDFASGHGSNSGKNSLQYVYAVSGTPSDSPGQWVDNKDGTVTDSVTGLMWQQATAPDTYDWKESLAYAEGLTLAGYGDWRLPTIKELRSLADYSKHNLAIDISVFPDTLSAIYWSSTTNTTTIYGTSVAWGMTFYSGHDNSPYKYQLQHVRAVRGGQSGSLGHLVIFSPQQASSWNVGGIMPIRWDAQGLGSDVKISLSRQGGKDGTFDIITESTANTGQYDWTVNGSASINCVIKIEQADNVANWATQGLFIIQSQADPAIFLLLLNN